MEFRKTADPDIDRRYVVASLLNEDPKLQETPDGPTGRHRFPRKQW